jgi:hypothetical protein
VRTWYPNPFEKEVVREKVVKPAPMKKRITQKSVMGT